MKLIILKNNLLEAFSILERAINTNVNLPILKHILFHARENKIIFTSTNLELAIEHTVSGKVIEEGSCAIPFGLMNGIIRNLHAERITLEQTGNTVLLSTENYEAKIQSQDAKEFPIIPSIHNTEQSIKLSVELFRDTLSSVIVATQYSEIRPEISGIYILSEGGELYMVATDSFRLAEQKVQAGVVSSFDKVSVIIPLRTAEELLRVVQGEEGDIEIFIDQNQILFVMNNNKIISRLIDGTFPEYRAIIPKNLKSEVLLEREECINGVKLASSFSGRAHDVTVSVGEGEKYLEISAADQVLGENRFRTPLKLKGETFSTVFNWKYLLDGLKIYSGKEILIGISQNGPAVIKDPHNTNLVYVLMPIRV